MGLIKLFMWRLKSCFSSAALAAAFAAVALPALASDPVEGVWSPVGDDARVRVAPCPGDGDRLCGTIIWVRAQQEGKEPPRDVHNPDARLRGRSVVGLPLMRDFQRAQTGQWTQGKIYDPESGRTYDANMRLNRDGTLKVEGCLGVFCLGQNWRRAG